MRITFFIILALLLALYMYYYYRAVKNLKYNVGLNGIDLSQFSLNGLTQNGSKIKIGISISIENDSNISISFSNLNIIGTYNDNLIFNSSQDEINNFGTIIIEKNNTTNINQIFDIYINKSSFDLIGKLKNKQSTNIDYTMSLKKLGINISTNQTYTT